MVLGECSSALQWVVIMISCGWKWVTPIMVLIDNC